LDDAFADGAIERNPAARIKNLPHRTAEPDPLSPDEVASLLKRSRALDLLGQSKLTLATRYGVTHLALFGSTARDSARADSDIDILVGLDGPATSARYFGVQFYLEDLFGCAVDLVTEKALRAELRPFIENEAAHV
jgi:predicted nucleotidyltransferase